MLYVELVQEPVELPAQPIPVYSLFIDFFRHNYRTMERAALGVQKLQIWSMNPSAYSKRTIKLKSC